MNTPVSALPIGGRIARSGKWRIWCLALLVLLPCFSVSALVFGRYWYQATAAAGWTARYDHSAISLNAKMWILGGYDSTHSYKNDVWYSQYGSSWTRATAAAPWHTRSGHTSVVFNNEMWVLGGHYWVPNVTTYLNDVWHSSDGAAWVQAPSAGWAARRFHTSVVFDNKIWVIGGASGSGYYNDVWYSTNGSSWVRATAAAQWAARAMHTSVVFNGKMWVFGGGNASGPRRDVWYSDDGVTWIQATAAAPWAARTYFTSVVNGGMMWVMGGFNSTIGEVSDVWYSSSGAIWTRATATPGWRARCGHASVLHDGKIWVLGGTYLGFNPLRDAWYTQGNYFVGDHGGFYPTVNQALSATYPGDEIYVAPGTYRETITLKSNVSLFAGYTGSGEMGSIEMGPGAKASSGSTATLPTIIDGTTSHAYHVVVMDSVWNTRLTGFTITGGNANGAGENGRGGGIYVRNANRSNLITDCTIGGNSASAYGGGGIYCTSSSLMITSCTISGNVANRGGGVLTSATAPSLVNCVISGNTASFGGAVYSSTGATSITNCTISGNSATTGGVYVVSNSDPVITNTIFEGNTAYAIYEADVGSDPVVRYDLFHSNPGGDYFNEATTGYTGADQINTNVDGALDNEDGNPLFATATSGTWTGVLFDPLTTRTVLTDSSASFTAGGLVGRIINPDTSQRFEALITSNTATTILVTGDLTGIVSIGDTYRLSNYHIQQSSAAANLGNRAAAPTTDFEGDPRPGADGQVDIGADEIDPPVAVAIRRLIPTSVNTNASTVSFVVQFSEPVWQIDNVGPPFDNFTVTTTSGDQAGTVTAVSAASGTTISVTVETANGRDGNLRLDLSNIGVIQDGSGFTLASSYTLGQEYHVDRVPPSVRSVTPATTGPTNADSLNFVVGFSEPVSGFNNAADVTVNHSGTAHTGVTIAAGSTSTYTVTVNGITGNGTFSLSVNAGGAQDAVGNLNTAGGPSAGVWIDNIAPVTAVGSLPTLVTTVTLAIPWSGSDEASGLQSARLFYRRGAAGPFTQYPGTYQTNPILFNSTLTGGDGEYYFYTIGTDYAGNQEAAPPTPDSRTKFITAPPAPPYLWGEPSYTQGTTNLLTWDSVPDATEYYLEWSTDSSFIPVAGNSGWIGPTSHLALGLLDNQLYYYRVKSRNEAFMESGWSNVASSRQDATAPTEPGTPTDAGAYSSSTAVRLNWTAASDAGSGVNSYELQVGTTPGGNDVYNGSIGNVLTRTVIGSNGQTLYARVRARDVVGNTSSWSGNSDGILVDTAAPTAPGTPTDAGAYTSSTSVRFDWTAATDTLSGLASYDLQVGTTPGGNNVFDGNVGNIQTRTVTGLNGQTLHARVRAHDNAGNMGSWSGDSNGILIDTVPPTGPSAPTDAGVYTSSTSVRFNWTAATDSGSGIASYDLQVGTTAGGSNVFNANVGNVTTRLLAGSNGQRLYARVRARDRAGHVGSWSPNSDGILVDTVAPTAPGTPRDTGAFTSSTSVTFNWTAATDPGTNASGVASYDLRVGTTIGGNDVFDGNVGTFLTKTVTGSNGQTLYARIRARDRAANLGQWSGNSDGITVDTVRPRLTEARALDLNTVRVTFDEGVINADKATNYFCTRGLRILAIDRQTEMVFSLRTSNQTTGTSYTVTVRSTVRDRAGNSIDPSYASRAFTGGARTAAGPWSLYR